MSGPPIHIALTFDDKFWAPAYTLMRSICLTTERRADIVFHLCHLWLSNEHKADIERIAEEFGSTLRYYDLDVDPQFISLARRAPAYGQSNYIVYARLLFETILPSEIDRLTYIDCDMMVCAPIEEIAEADLEGHPIGAVPDPHGMHIGPGREMRENRDLFDPAVPYFNAGLMVIDMAGWRASNVPGEFQRIVADGTIARLHYADQDILNIVFRRNWHAFDQLWNVTDPQRAHEGLKPKLLHYTGHKKPWKARPLDRNTGIGFARMYRHVMTNELYWRYTKFRWKGELKRLIWSK